MNATHLLGIDIGTQGVKAALFDRQGRRLAAAFRKSRLLHPVAGAVEEDPEYQFQSVCQCTKACLKESEIDPASARAILSNLVQSEAIPAQTGKLLASLLSDTALRSVPKDQRSVLRADLLKQALIHLV